MICKLQNKEVVLPDFFIIGAGKSGTTSIHNYLSVHPSIFLPDIKETWYLQLRYNPNKEILSRLNFIPKTIEEYVGIFEQARQFQTIGDITPSYQLFHRKAIKSIHEIYPTPRKVKIISILREPLERILSLYRFNLLIQTEHLSLERAIINERKRFLSFNKSVGFNYLYSSLYYDQILNFKNNFDNVLVLFFEDLKISPSKVVSDICNFIGVDETPSTKSDVISKIYNKSKGRNKNNLKAFLINNQPIPYAFLPQFLKRKIAYYKYSTQTFADIDERIFSQIKHEVRMDVEKLEILLGIDLENWKTKYS